MSFYEIYYIGKPFLYLTVAKVVVFNQRYNKNWIYFGVCVVI